MSTEPNPGSAPETTAKKTPEKDPAIEDLKKAMKLKIELIEGFRKLTSENDRCWVLAELGKVHQEFAHGIPTSSPSPQG